MLLAIRSKSRRESSVRVDYLIHVQEIKPWPLSQSSRGQTPVVLHWERGDRHSGSTRRATPQGGQGIDNDKIVFNESFLLPATLFRESKNKSRSMTEERFQKKCLELNLYESKSERLGKGHLLGSAVVDLAEYGVPKSSISLNLPLKVKRGSRLAAQQPALFLSIGPYDRNSVPEGLDSEKSQASVSPSSSSGYNTLSSRTSLDKDSKDSVAATEFSDEGAEEAEIMSFTDPDTDGESSHHSMPLVNVLEAKVDSASTKLEDNPRSREVEEEPEGVEINSEGVQKILVSSLDILPVETSSSSSKAVHSSPGVSCASSASHSSYSGSLDNEVRLRTSPQLNFGSTILSQISPSFSLTSSEHKLGKHSNTNNRDTGEVPLGNIQEDFGGKTQRKQPEEIKVDAIVTSFDDTVDKEFPGVNEKGKIKPGEDKREITEGSYSLGDLGSDQRKLEIKTFKLNDGKNEYEDSLNKKGKIKPREDKREITEGSYSLGDTGLNQRQLEIKTFKLNDGKNEYEANGFYSEVVTAGEEEATTQAPVAEFMIEEEAPKRLTGGAQGAEVVVDKIAQLEKVAQKEGSYQSAEPCSRLAKAAMEKPVGVKHASKPFRDPPKKGTKAGTEVRNGGKNGPGSRVKSVQDSKPKNLKGPVKSTSDSDTNSVAELDDKFIEEVKEINISEIPSSNPGNGAMDETDEKPDERVSKEENMKIIFAEARAAVADEKVKQMELEIEKLEGELREAAAVEAALYSVVAEHGSSSHKVHSPARRLARLYIHACKHWSQDRRAGAARNAVSGLILVAKACGNDVSRLTFWWSNTIVLRETVSQAFESCQLTEQLSHANGRNGMKINQRLPSPHRSRDNITKQGREKLKKLNEWDETQTFVTALQEIESWIHGRIVESVWWQTLTPYMQSPSEVTITQYRRLYSRRSLEKLLGPELGDHQQGKFSIDLWKKAFLDAFQRLCPVRAGGHECGCLPVLAKMVMEQCVARLDVAMFNAILRQSEEEMPTDPISDPITDPSVLPIPAGNLCFGSGAQLKNAVGNWSRFLTDLVGIDAENPFQEGVDIEEDYCEDLQELLNSFPLLNATSDLLMLPKDLLMDKSIRNEVCPVLSLPIIKRILCNFVPDEFCPDPVPLQLMETINAEIPLERRLQRGEDSNSSSLVSAPPVAYSPPPVSLVKDKLGGANDIHLRRSASGVLRKGYTSDDELDELESPISLLVESVPAMSSQKNKVHSNGKSGGNTKQPTIKAGLNRRYQLLREAWADK